MSSHALLMDEIAALSVTQAIAQKNAVDYDTWMPEQRWDNLEHALTKLRDQAVDGPGQEAYVDAYRAFIDYTDRNGHTVLDRLQQWQADRPDSRFAPMLEVGYWASWFAQYRTAFTVDHVTPAMWACARTAQDALFCALIKMLSKDPTAWPPLISVLYTVAALGEPEWWQRWLLNGERPASLPSRGRGDEIDARLMQSGADAIGAQYCATLPDRLPEPLTADTLTWRREQGDERSAVLQYWVRVAFVMDPHALDAAVAYVSLRMPRWGGSWEDMLAFADSPLCDRYEERDRNVLRFFAWFDELEVDDSDRLADPRVLKHHLRLGHRLLERPLPDNLRGRVHKYLAYLESRNGRIDAACAHYASSAPHNHYEDWAISRAISTWCDSQDQGPWLGRIAEVNRLVSAHGAALYGLLCLNGWAGVAHRPDVADGWFTQAVDMTADLADVPSSPFTGLSKFAEHFTPEALLPMWLKAAELGVASAQFCCGNHFMDVADPSRAIRYFRQAADNRHEVAMYNVAALSMKSIREGEVAGAQVEAVAADALSYLDKALARSEALVEAHCTEFGLEQLENVNSLCGSLLHSDWPPLPVRKHVLPHVLKYAHEGRVDSMISLAWWYGDKTLDAYRHEEAVRWIEAARHIDPDNEYLHKVRAFVEGDSLWSKLKFALAQRKAMREGLPGQSDTVL